MAHGLTTKTTHNTIVIICSQDTEDIQTQDYAWTHGLIYQDNTRYIVIICSQDQEDIQTLKIFKPKTTHALIFPTLLTHALIFPKSRKSISKMMIQTIYMYTGYGFFTQIRQFKRIKVHKIGFIVCSSGRKVS